MLLSVVIPPAAITTLLAARSVNEVFHWLAGPVTVTVDFPALFTYTADAAATPSTVNLDTSIEDRLESTTNEIVFLLVAFTSEMLAAAKSEADKVTKFERAVVELPAKSLT
jgi:hypothetical protein